MEVEEEEQRTNPVAVFMAFGTKGDVFPIAAIASGFASDQRQYRVFLVTHLAHEHLRSHLTQKHVMYRPISSPPILSTDQIQESTGSAKVAFSLQKKTLIRDHRKECFSVIDEIFGRGPSMDGDFIAINFFALEGWSLAELFRVRCIVAAPYVVPYSAPSSYERRFKKEHPLLYKYLREAPLHKVCWDDVIHWMWPLFTENWETWRRDLNLSPCPFTDPVTGLPEWHERAPSPLLLYGFSKEVVECPDYWPSSVRVCGFWFLLVEWQFSCKNCREISIIQFNKTNKLCSAHLQLQSFLKARVSEPLIFIGLSSVGSMGGLKDPLAFLQVLQTVLEITSYRILLLTAGYEPLDAAVQAVASESTSQLDRNQSSEDCLSLFNHRLFCFSGSIPYSWLFARCDTVVHHGGSGTTAAALQAGTPQVVCPFMHDQFYWAERMCWLGVAPEPLKRDSLFPETHEDTSIRAAANALSGAVNDALSPQIKARALRISNRISLEDGVLESVKCIKQELCCFDSETP